MKVNILKFPTTEEFLKLSNNCQEHQQINNAQSYNSSSNCNEKTDKKKPMLLNLSEKKLKGRICLKNKNENVQIFKNNKNDGILQNNKNKLVVRSYQNFQLLLHNHGSSTKTLNFKEKRKNFHKFKQLKPSKFKISRYTIDDLKSNNIFKTESEKAFEKMLSHKKMIEFLLKNKQNFESPKISLNASPINSFTNMMLNIYSKMKIFSSNFFQPNNMKPTILQNESISNRETYMRKLNNTACKLFPSIVNKNECGENQKLINYSTNYSNFPKYNTFEFMNKVIEKESLIRKQEQIRPDSNVSKLKIKKMILNFKPICKERMFFKGNSYQKFRNLMKSKFEKRKL